MIISQTIMVNNKSGQSISGKSWHNGIDWVIVGGESGHHARPMHPQWVRSIRNQCAAAGVPFFFKQWGEWVHDPEDWNAAAGLMRRVGKKAAGRLLDGKEWNQFPQVEELAQ